MAGARPPIDLRRHSSHGAYSVARRVGEGTIVKLRLAFCAAAFFAVLAPAFAQDSLQGLAPADEYFGHYNLSVLGIANTIRDAGTRIDSGADARSMLSGPLSFVTESMKDWEQKYPADPWIAKDLLALEIVYLRVPTDEGFRLATKTEAWLIADYSGSEYAAKGRVELATNRVPYMPQEQPWQPQQQAWQPQPQPRQYQAPAIPSYATPWGRYAAMRVPFPPR
jgi:hypothetical protein